MATMLPYAYLPENYQFFECLAEDKYGMPQGAVIFGVLIGETKATLAAHEVDPVSSMDFANPQSVVDYLHANMEDNEGLVEVGCGKSKSNNPIIYNILKKTLYDDGRPGNQYLLHLNLQIQEHVYFIHGVFEEYGTTGIRDNAVFARYRHDHPDQEDPFEGWRRDPYDPAFTKGFLMNLSEQEQFDKFFPNHPLSRARTYISFIAENN